MPATHNPKPQRRIGERIRALRIERGLTQLALAHRIGQEGPDAGAFISRIEAETAWNPRLDTLTRLAQALGVTVDELLNGKEEAKKLADNLKRTLGSM